ncbi:probable transmembrane reductase CYB561D1 isoform X1 [Cyprinus carpio]|uniref:ascorbate ferrireductase (transmembrane) n=1 Tax=Cyprinus carpio TaxID=7962 RepID=A0A9Q9V5N6_CYPCA|nr:probable transmembrane reductase CYB561D1 isoform X1 [Cyprinus carpio]
MCGCAEPLCSLRTSSHWVWSSSHPYCPDQEQVSPCASEHQRFHLQQVLWQCHGVVMLSDGNVIEIRGLFSWHPVCMSLGFCLCMTEGILLFSAECSPFCFKSRKWKVRLHWFFQAVLLVCGATGFGFMVASKNIKEHPHFTSWHSLLGVTTMAATVLQAICGVFLLFPKLISTRSFPRLRLYHATCGLLAYLLATVTVMSAMFTDWFQASVTGTVWYVFLLLPLFPALVVMNQITSAFLPKKKITI